MKASTIALACLSLGLAALRADEQPSSPTAASAAADLQDLVLLAPRRPLVLRLHIQLEGQPYQSTWGDFLWERFSEMDANGDGVLGQDEFEVANWQAVYNQGRDTAGRSSSRNTALSFFDFDNATFDDAITFDEFVANLGDRCFSLGAASGIQVLGLTDSPNVARGGNSRDALLTRLAGDDDGAIAREGIAAAITELYRFDINEDELLSENELVADGNPFANRFAQAQVNRSTSQSSAALAPIPGAPRDALARAVFNHYDRPAKDAAEGNPPDAKSDGRLTPQELALAPEEFALADSDGSGALSETEFAAWLAAKPVDAELAVNLDAGADAESRLQMLPASAESSSASASSASGYSIEPAQDGKLTIRGLNCEIVLSVNGAVPFEKQRSGREATFKSLDSDQNGYLDEQEMRNQTGGNRRAFLRFDADGDGKVFLKEFLHYFESIQQLAQKRVSASVSDQGSRLVQIVDANSNGQLSLRELRALPALLAGWDADGNGMIASTELPRRYHVQIGTAEGTTTLNATAVPVALGASMSTEAKLAGKGPDWFQRMDRNGDEDVSRREFFGSRADFDRLDTDRDGLIDLREAEAAVANQ
ncbi:MAG: hypothetical protein AB7U73_16525 [Pirellulales bacterium]